MKGKMIVIEGTDCSGKETQTNLLENKMKENNISLSRMSFPAYNSATGKIVGGSYLGKKHISECLFEEGPVNVDPKVAALFYAADRLYNVELITKPINEGKVLLLDRYVESNMAHQGSKIENKSERQEMYKWLETLEYDFLKLPKPDIVIFLYMPFLQAKILKNGRTEDQDLHESNDEHLKLAEKTYKELADLKGFYTVNCVDGQRIKTPLEIHEEVWKIVSKQILGSINE